MHTAPKRRTVRHTICGLDEAGRGALAGPLVLAAVVMPADFDFGLVRGDVVVRDSTKLSERLRLRVLELIENYSLAIETEVIPVGAINRIGIGWANTEGFLRLIRRVEADHYIVDGRGNLGELDGKGDRVAFMIDADEINPMALAAGVVAKVTRDVLMRELDRQFPAYRWRTNTDHGTDHHIVAIEAHGTCRFHRHRFVQTALANFRARGLDGIVRSGKTTDRSARRRGWRKSPTERPPATRKTRSKRNLRLRFSPGGRGGTRSI